MTVLFAAWLALTQSVPASVPTIDFSVTTSDGTPVTDLTAADVTLKIDGKTRPIRSLRVVRMDEAAAAGATAIPAPYETNALTADGRSLVIALDQDSFRAGREQPFREAVTGLLASLGPRDRVLFVALPFGGVKVPFTTDRGRVSRAVMSTVGQRSQNESGSEMACRTRRLLEETASFLERLTYADTPTSVVFITGGMAGPRRDAAAAMAPGMCELTVEPYNRVGRAAGAARANFYVVHPDDVSGSLRVTPDTASSFTGSDNPMEGIEHLAGVTGGRRLPLTATGTGALARVARETSSYYVAEFEGDPADRDGRSRQVSVRVARRGTQVQFRPQATFTAARAVLGLRTSAFASKGPAGTIKILAIVEPSDPLAIFTRASATLFDENGRAAAQWQAAEPAQVPLTGVMTVAPGTYRLRVAAEAGAAGAGTAETVVTARLTEAGPLLVGDLILGVSRDGVVVPKLEFGAEPVALGSLEFHGQPAGGKLTIGLEIARALDGPALLATPLVVERTGDEDYRATGAIAIAALPPGDYAVRAVIELEGQPPVRVVRALRKVKR